MHRDRNRFLEPNKLITRTQNNTMPVSVDYELTEIGKSLHQIIDTMGTWGSGIESRS
ncbi:MAG: winged helix-turn-helix transcriptional regulator [Sphingobacterium sp.]